MKIKTKKKVFLPTPYSNTSPLSPGSNGKGLGFFYGYPWILNPLFRCAACFPGRIWWPGAVNPGQDEENALLSIPQAWSSPARSQVFQIWATCCCASLLHRSRGDTEACLPRALCSPAWKQLISNCLHSNYLIVQKHCLVFQFSLSHCLPEGLFNARSLIWVGAVPVREVNCQEKKKHHGSQKPNSPWPGPSWVLDV